MKFVQFLSVILLVALVYQTNCESSVSGTARTIFDEILEILRNLNVFIEGLLTQLDDFVDNIYKQIENLQRELIRAFASEITAIASGFIAILEEIKQNATNAGVDFVNCTEEYLPELEQLPITVLDEVTKCVTNEAEDIVSHIRNITGDIHSTYDIIEDLTEQLFSCNATGAEEVVCITNIINQIAQVYAQLPGEIQSEIENIQAIAEELPQRVNQCVAVHLQELETGGQQILDEVAQCIENSKILKITT